MERGLNEVEIEVHQEGVQNINVINESEAVVDVKAEQGIIRGVDGVSPIAKVEQLPNGAEISITDIDGTTTATVHNGLNGRDGAPGPRGLPGPAGPAGRDGTNGQDGFSPTATVTKSGDTATITITDKNGTTTATVSDGTTPTVDNALSWSSTNPVENQVVRKTIYTKNSSDEKEAGIYVPLNNPNLNPYVHLGSKSSATKGNSSVGIGYNAEASAIRSVAIGNGAKAASREGVALGPSATAGQYSLSIGYNTNTVPNYSTAVGPYAKVLTGATNATAIGYQSEADEAETVSVGKSSNKRRIVNVADGTTATDAATVGQIPAKTSDLINDGSDNTSTYLEADETAYRGASIPFGAVDDTSTSTAFTATVPGITALRDGVCMWLKNGVVTSASGFTININGLGAKPVYSNQAAATRESTLFNVNYTFFFVYDSTRVEGGCWMLDRGYNSNDNTIGYQIRTNSTAMTTTNRTRYYRLLFTSADNTQWVPANTQYDNSATSNKTVNQGKINPFGRIVYLGNSTNYAAGAAVSATAVWDQYVLTLGYSFAKGSALTMTYPKPVYLKCAPQTDGSAIIDSTTPWVQDLPTTEDGKIYIFLGIATSATAIELQLDHPVYYFKDGAIRLWTAAAATSWSDVTNKPTFATVATTGAYSDLSGTPTIPPAPKLVDLDGQIQTSAYHRSVVALCRVSTTANTELNSWSSGRIALHRANGLAGIADININMENQYSGAYYTNVSYFSNVGLIASNGSLDSSYGFRPCTFKYNDVYYGGIEICISNVNLSAVYYTGVGNFDVFGLDYYTLAHDGAPGSALNSEVYNSINFTQWTKANGSWVS